MVEAVSVIRKVVLAYGTVDLCKGIDSLTKFIYDKYD